MAPEALLAHVLQNDRGRLLAALITRIGDFQRAEDALQEAAASALVHWGRSGAPTSPTGWLLRAALRKAIDAYRRDATLTRHVDAIAVLAEEEAAEHDPQAIPDERLRLIFTCCHPALELKSRVALTLRTLGGLSTAEVARAFLDEEPTMGQRLSRAKAKIAAAGIPFSVPGPEDWPDRLNGVLTVIYLIFNEGYSATRGETPVRASLCDEAIWLCRVLLGLAPDEPEVLGLLSLMLTTDARRPARLSPEGEIVALDEQDRSLWDQARLAEGMAVLDQAIALRQRGPFQIKAAISALHSHPTKEGRPDWPQILALYDALVSFEPTDVVRLNRAVALAEVEGPKAGLAAIATLAPALEAYQPFHAVHADLLRRADLTEAAIAAYDKAIALSGTDAERRFLVRRRGLAVKAKKRPSERSA